MNRLLGVFALTLLITGCASIIQNNNNEIEITDFKQGLMKKDTEGKWYVYEESLVMEFEINGECTANKVKMPCMYFGYSYNYSAKKQVDSLDCVTSFDRELDLVNPKEKVGKKTSFTWKQKLKDGYVFNLRYQAQDKNDKPEDMALVAMNECSYNGKPILNFVETVTNEIP